MLHSVVLYSLLLSLYISTCEHIVQPIPAMNIADFLDQGNGICFFVSLFLCFFVSLFLHYFNAFYTVELLLILSW